MDLPQVAVGRQIAAALYHAAVERLLSSKLLRPDTDPRAILETLRVVAVGLLTPLHAESGHQSSSCLCELLRTAVQHRASIQLLRSVIKPLWIDLLRAKLLQAVTALQCHHRAGTSHHA